MIGACGSILTEFFFGGYTVELKALLVFMAFDILTGVMTALYGHSNKSEHGALSSYRLWRGLCKKVVTLFVLSCSHYCDVILDINYVFNACAYPMIAGELVSILENYCLLAGNPPAVLTKVLEVMQKKGDVTND